MPFPRRDHFRDTRNYALAIASEVGAPFLRAVTAGRSRGKPTPPREWRSGVILGADHAGDVLYRTGSLGHLSRLLPDCRWTYVTSPVGAELLAGNPAIASVVTGRHAGEGKDSIVELLGGLAPDVVLCTNAVRGHVELFDAVRAGVPNRVAYSHKGFAALATLGVDGSAEPSYAHLFRLMVATITGAAPTWSVRPWVHLTSRDVAAAEDVIARFGGRDVPFVAVALTTRQATYAPPVELLLESLAIASRRARMKIVLTGADQDRPQLESISRRATFDHEMLVGELGVRAFIAFLGACAVAVSSDTGARHFANAAGTPVVFARSLGDSRLTAAYCESEYDIAPPGSWLDPSRQTALYATVSPADVADTILRVMRPAPLAAAPL